MSTYCHANLDKYKRPREIVILDELRKRGPGKIDKPQRHQTRELRAEHGLEIRVQGHDHIK